MTLSGGFVDQMWAELASSTERPCGFPFACIWARVWAFLPPERGGAPGVSFDRGI